MSTDSAITILFNRFWEWPRSNAAMKQNKKFFFFSNIRVVGVCLQFCRNEEVKKKVRWSIA